MAATIFPPYRHIILASRCSKHKHMMISSPAFAEGGAIPEPYGCTGEALSPPLQIDQVPSDALYLALIMDDPDAPGGTYDHWINWNMPLTEFIAADSHPGISGSNSSGKTGYHAPCPPSGTHRYYFQVYALDHKLDLPAGSGRKELEQAMQGHILAEATLMGTYAH